MGKYTLTEEHRAKLPEWRDKWIANALKTGPYSDSDKARAIEAVEGLYRAADLAPPSRIMFCESPVSAAIASAIAHGVWWLRQNDYRHVAMFGRILTPREIDAARDAAVRVACGVKSASRIGSINAFANAATGAATSDATRAATSAATDAATTAATSDATNASTTAATYDSTFAATNAATGAATSDATDAATNAATYAATNAATSDATYAATNAATSAATYAATNAATFDATDDATDAATGAATGAAISAATYAATGAATDAITRFLLSCLKYWYRCRDGGNQWSGWSSFISFFRHVAKLNLDYSKWQHYETIAEFGPRFMHTEFCIISELPEYIRRDDRNRPHCETGPFCRWRDGRELYYWHGTEVPRHWVMDKASLNPSEVLRESNGEKRRAGCEIIGWARILDMLDARVIDTDQDPMIGTLYECDLPDSPRSRFLRVQCGTGRTFCIPVPNTIDTALAANARTYRWTGSLEDFRAYAART